MKITLLLVLLMHSCVLGQYVLEEVLNSEKNFIEIRDLSALSPKCQNSIYKITELFKNGTIEDKIFALKFFDASALLPKGILVGNFYNTGNYEECMGIYKILENEEIFGKYCFGTVAMNMGGFQTQRNGNLRVLGSKLIGIHIAHCLPHTCTAEDFNQLHISNFTDQFCYTKAEANDFDASDITAIVILSILLLLVILSTGIDLATLYLNKEVPNKLLLVFSIWSNGKKILQTSNSSDQLSCINGMRAISMIWVIFAHLHSNLLLSGFDNFLELQTFQKQAKNMYIMAAPISVDTFFALGGVVVMYVFLKSVKKGVRFNLPMYYVHRYLRLTPALAVIVLFNATLLKHMGSGPFWGSVEDSISPCRDYWWSALLYIQNYVNPENICVGQSWYLSTDMQLFALTPLILIPMQKWPKMGILSLILLSIVGIIVPLVVTYEMDLVAGMSTDEAMPKYMKYYYYQTYARFGPYVIGMITGYLIYAMQDNSEFALNKIKSNKKIILILWIIAIGGLMACTYGGADVLTQKINDRASRAVYNGFNRNAWAVAVCMVVTLCCSGCGGFINDFLSLPIFQLLSKLSYSMYLVHYTWVITLRMLSTKVLGHFDELSIMHAFWGDFMITFFISFIICAVFESPMIIIEKAIFGDHKSKSSEKKSPLPS